MAQPSPKRWKHTAFTALAQMEYALRGGFTSVAPSDLRRIRNFLFLQSEAPLGSVIHATPMFEALRRAVPDAHISVAASPMASSVLGGNPCIDGCEILPSPFGDFAAAVHTIRDCVQSMPPGPRCILTTVGNQRTRIALTGLLAGKSIRAGYTVTPEIYHLPLQFRAERGQIEANLDILRSLGHDVSFCEPRIFFTKADTEHASLLLDAAGQNPNSPRIAFVTQSSGGQRTQWSAERFQQVSGRLSATCGAIPIFVGTAADVAAIEALRKPLVNRGILTAGKTTIPQLAAVLAQCDLVVSLDTGTFHVARAVGLPGVVLSPAWQTPLEWLPVQHPRYRVLRGPSIPAAPLNYWIEEVSGDQVTEAALDLLRHFPPAPALREARVRHALTPLVPLRQ